MVNSREILLIDDFCKHHNYYKANFDDYPMPVPEGDKSQWIKDPWEL